jgi:transposase InsO family protein
MPWKSISVMESRLEFVRLAEQGGVSVAELCRRFGISRQTGFAYIQRYRAEGEAGLAERSRRPLSSPLQCPQALEARILALRTEHPRWGGRKLARRLHDLGVADVPSPSTVTEVLRRHGQLDLQEADKHRAFKRFEHTAPNELWQMDFKGHVAMDAGRCHPLTVLDDHSRFSVGLLACGDEQHATVRGHLTALFRRYGLPRAILCDNGPPWGGCGWQQATALQVWLMRVGVRVLHGRPYHPQTQGKDERFHRTLNIELLQGRRFADLPACQARFDDWRHIYNEQRPHEALDLAVPASRYQASPVCFPEQLPAPEYYPTDQVRQVGPDGTARFQGRRIKLSQCFAGLPVAFRPTGQEGVWQVFFMRFAIAQASLRDGKPLLSTVKDVSEHPSTMSPV